MSITEFNAMVVNNSGELKPFAISLTRDHEAALDLCQETLYKAFAYREKYQPGTNIRAWLYTIMRNIFINDYRRNGRKRSVMDNLATTQPVKSSSADAMVRLKEIDTSIQKLPEVFRTSCLLYLQGYQYREIADALQEPLGTIKSRIHFAKKILQKQLDR